MSKKDTYQLIDSGDFRKLEQVGPYRLLRPSAQALWKPSLPKKEWDRADAVFTRSSELKGSWKLKNSSMPHEWIVNWSGVACKIKLTDFGHIGIFPEHHRNEALLAKSLQGTKGQAKSFLNLFAYTGALSLQAANFGAKVVHCDSSKTSVAWAKENGVLSKLDHCPVRWITEDVRKFVARELRRGSRYDVIALDPPSFGRGVKGEVWKIEEHLGPLLADLKQLLSDSFSYIQLSAHSPGYTPLALKNILLDHFSEKKGDFEFFEMLIEAQNGVKPLPSGACCIFSPRSKK